MPFQVNLFGRPVKRRIEHVYKDVTTPYQEFIEAYFQANRSAPPKKKKSEVRIFNIFSINMVLTNPGVGLWDANTHYAV